MLFPPSNPTVGAFAIALMAVGSACGGGPTTPLNVPPPGISSDYRVDCGTVSQEPLTFGDVMVTISYIDCGTAISTGDGGIAKMGNLKGGAFAILYLQAQGLNGGRAPSPTVRCSDGRLVEATNSRSVFAYHGGEKLRGDEMQGTVVFPVPGDCAGPDLVFQGDGVEQVAMRLFPQAPAGLCTGPLC